MFFHSQNISGFFPVKWANTFFWGFFCSRAEETAAKFGHSCVVVFFHLEMKYAACTIDLPQIVNATWKDMCNKTSWFIREKAGRTDPCHSKILFHRWNESLNVQRAQLHQKERRADGFIFYSCRVSFLFPGFDSSLLTFSTRLFFVIKNEKLCRFLSQWIMISHHVSRDLWIPCLSEDVLLKSGGSAGFNGICFSRITVAAMHLLPCTYCMHCVKEINRFCIHFHA